MENNFQLPVMNHIDLKITYACNYQCEYCYQRNKDGTRPHDFLSKENAENFVKFCRRLGSSFHITLAGGEPFVYPYLQYLGEELTQMGNTVNLITNFSVDFEKIKRFIEGCNGKLDWFSISIHLTQWTDMELFYKKLRQLIDYNHDVDQSFNIVCTCVVTNDNFKKVQEMDLTMNQEFKEIQVQYQRVLYDGVYDIYTDEIEAFLAEKGLSMTIKKEEANTLNFYGRKCWAGSRFFYIESNGDVRRCYTPQQNNKLFYLGNLEKYEEIKINEDPVPCLSRKGDCICFPHFVNSKFITECVASQSEIDEYKSK